MSRSPHSSRRRPCVVSEEDDGLSKLECFLKGYRRVTRDHACQSQMVGEPVVWAYKDNLWGPVDQAEVKRTIEKASPEKSICAALFSNLFKLDDTQSETLKSAFDDVTFPDVVGLYEKQGRFVIVVRIPYTMPLWTRRGIGNLSAFGAYAAVQLGNSAIRSLFRSQRAKMILECFKTRYNFKRLFNRSSNALVVFGKNNRSEEDSNRELCVKKILAWDEYRRTHGSNFMKIKPVTAVTLYRG